MAIKMTIKQILDVGLIKWKENEANLLEARKTMDYSKVQMCRGIAWGKDKETGNLYHAYCEFCGDLFEDATQYKKDCEQYARKRGWIIGNTKETRDIAICPKCKEKIIQQNIQ